MTRAANRLRERSNCSSRLSPGPRKVVDETMSCDTVPQSIRGERMQIYLKFVTGVLLVLVCAANVAGASPDPCFIQERDLSRSERLFSAAEIRLSQSQDRLARLEDQIAFRQYAYQAQIAQAEANASATSAISGGFVVRCVIRAIFGYQFGFCASRSMSSYIGSQARSRAGVNAAIRRSNAYTTFAQGALYREGLRVVTAQDEYATKTTLYQTAQVAYDLCRTTAPSQ